MDGNEYVKKHSWWFKTKQVLWELAILSIIYFVFNLTLINELIPDLLDSNQLMAPMINQIFHALLFAITFMIARKLLAGLRYQS